MQTISSHQNKELLTSKMADHLIPSEIIKLANEIKEMVKNGANVFNLTIGDFDPKIFPIPDELKEFIIQAYKEDQTNYPEANGILDLRKYIAISIRERLKLEYIEDQILVSGGARPLIYALYKTIIDPGDQVIFPVPSWNNNHYCHLCGAKGIALEVGPNQNFMPMAKDLEPYIQEASLIALCSPQNPTGTVFSKASLLEIAELVLKENNRRKGNQKPLYLMYDQIYWELCFGQTEHYHPVFLIPELRDYVISIDGMSKAFAATGIRVGWAFGPMHILSKMRAILSHVGAWSPKPEQVGTAHFLREKNGINNYLNWFRLEVQTRLNNLYKGIMELKNASYPIDAIHPQAAIYLTVKCPWMGYTAKGKLLVQQKDVTNYLLTECQVGFVPFNAFGSYENSEWYRISVGTLRNEDVELIINSLKLGMEDLSPSDRN